jgi:hypothetical protein
MTLSDLASIGSFISGSAVLISLIYLAHQVRQTERNQRAIIQQGRAARTMDMLLRTADPALVRAWTRGRMADVDLSDVEIYQFGQVFGAVMANAEDSFYQHSSRLLDDASFNSQLSALRHILSFPGPRVMWKLTKSGFEQSFVEFIDETVRGVSAAPYSDIAAIWKEAAAEESAMARSDP